MLAQVSGKSNYFLHLCQPRTIARAKTASTLGLVRQARGREEGPRGRN
ncbi:MAG: hypothetical protein ACRC62_28710 [Microcoleus sp.]